MYITGVIARVPADFRVIIVLLRIAIGSDGPRVRVCAMKRSRQGMPRREKERLWCTNTIHIE